MKFSASSLNIGDLVQIDYHDQRIIVGIIIKKCDEHVRIKWAPSNKISTYTLDYEFIPGDYKAVKHHKVNWINQKKIEEQCSLVNEQYENEHFHQ